MSVKKDHFTIRKTLYIASEKVRRNENERELFLGQFVILLVLQTENNGSNTGKQGIAG